ncbi:MAG: hypothetical protein ACR2GX_00635, partial [Candidatus Dormibacteria bacterium]
MLPSLGVEDKLATSRIGDRGEGQRRWHRSISNFGMKGGQGGGGTRQGDSADAIGLIPKGDSLVRQVWS